MAEGFKDIVKAKIVSAMKAGEKVRLTTLRGLMSALQYEEMKNSTEALSNEASLTVTQSEIKKRRETLELISGKGKESEESTLQLEIEVLQELLPTQLDQDALSSLIKDYIGLSEKPSVGLVMKHLNQNFTGQFDPKMASEMAKSFLK